MCGEEERDRYLRGEREGDGYIHIRSAKRKRGTKRNPKRGVAIGNRSVVLCCVTASVPDYKIIIIL